MLLYDSDGLVVRAHLQAGINGVAEQNLFWNFADTFAPSTSYDPNKQWLEGYVKPGLSFSKDLDGGLNVYGKGSFVTSGTMVSTPTTSAIPAAPPLRKPTLD